GASSPRGAATLANSPHAVNSNFKVVYGAPRASSPLRQAPKALRDWTTVRWQPDIDNSSLFRPATLGGCRGPGPRARGPAENSPTIGPGEAVPHGPHPSASGRGPVADRAGEGRARATHPRKRHLPGTVQ